MKINKTKYIEVIAEDGYKLTTYKEGEDIKNFSCFSKGCFPLTFDVDSLREITIEEAEELQKQAEEAIEESNTEE